MQQLGGVRRVHVRSLPQPFVPYVLIHHSVASSLGCSAEMKNVCLTEHWYCSSFGHLESPPSGCRLVYDTALADVSGLQTFSCVALLPARTSALRYFVSERAIAAAEEC